MRANRQQATRSLGALAFAAGLVLLVMAVARWQGAPELTLPEVTVQPTEEPTATQPPVTEPPPSGEQIVPDEGLTTVVVIIFGIVALVVGILLLRALILFLARLSRDRRPSRREGAEISGIAVGAPASAEAVAEAVRTGIAGALFRIEGEGLPGDAIVAAWVGLEESAAEAGVKRGLAETPAEFTMRIIAPREAVAAEAAALLRLYERVRFGGWEAQEPDRARAREALQKIERAWR